MMTLLRARVLRVKAGDNGGHPSCSTGLSMFLVDLNNSDKSFAAKATTREMEREGGRNKAKKGQENQFVQLLSMVYSYGLEAAVFLCFSDFFVLPIFFVHIEAGTGNGRKVWHKKATPMLPDNSLFAPLSWRSRGKAKSVELNEHTYTVAKACLPVCLFMFM